MISIVDHKIDVPHVIASVSHEGAGAINVFIGTTRNKTLDKKVLKLSFESYLPMAISELQLILDRAIAQWPILNCAIVHRIGVVEIGEEAVVIAVAAAHRKASFEACEFIIDELKKSVPIWKKEIFEDGEVWVSAHP